MKAFERRDLIIKELYRQKKVHVAELAQKFNVSEETIRRDLDKLDKEGLAKKIMVGPFSTPIPMKILPISADIRSILKRSES